MQAEDLFGIVQQQVWTPHCHCSQFSPLQPLAAIIPLICSIDCEPFSDDCMYSIPHHLLTLSCHSPVLQIPELFAAIRSAALANQPASNGLEVAALRSALKQRRFEKTSVDSNQDPNESEFALSPLETLPLPVMTLQHWNTDEVNSDTPKLPQLNVHDPPAMSNHQVSNTPKWSASVPALYGNVPFQDIASVDLAFHSQAQRNVSPALTASACAAGDLPSQVQNRESLPGSPGGAPASVQVGSRETSTKPEPAVFTTALREESPVSYAHKGHMSNADTLDSSAAVAVLAAIEKLRQEVSTAPPVA